MIIIDYKDSRPLYEQITEKLRTLILKGVLQSGEQMPSVRSLAMELSINPNTIQRAFSELEREGYVYTVKGRGNFVADSDALLCNQKLRIRQEIVDKVKHAIEYGVDIEDIVNDIRKGEAND